MQILKQGTYAFLSVLTFLILFSSGTPTTWAHGGEDHGESKPAPAANPKGIITQTTKVGDLEVLLKHAPFEPDTAGAARLFITNFATNEPFGNAAPTVEIVASDGKTYQAETEKSDQPGSFNVKLPPLPEGKYTISARVNEAAKSGTATFSNVNIAHAEESASPGESVWAWAQNILLALGGILALGAIGVLGYFAFRFAQRQSAANTNNEAVSA